VTKTVKSAKSAKNPVLAIGQNRMQIPGLFRGDPLLGVLGIPKGCQKPTFCHFLAKPWVGPYPTHTLCMLHRGGLGYPMGYPKGGWVLNVIRLIYLPVFGVANIALFKCHNQPNYSNMLDAQLCWAYLNVQPPDSQASPSTMTPLGAM